MTEHPHRPKPFEPTPVGYEVADEAAVDAEGIEDGEGAAQEAAHPDEERLTGESDSVEG
jgi:hypothetical protein